MQAERDNLYSVIVIYLLRRNWNSRKIAMKAKKIMKWKFWWDVLEIVKA
jgi:hypothetical protein